MKNFKKRVMIRLVCFISIIVVAFLFITVFLNNDTIFSKGSFKSKGCMTINTKNSMSMHYLDFKGYKYAVLKLKSGDTLDIVTRIKTRKGNLNISLVDSNNNKLYETKNSKEEINKKVKINKDGSYKLKIAGNHKGSCKISWNVNK